MTPSYTDIQMEKIIIWHKESEKSYFTGAKDINTANTYNEDESHTKS